MPNDAFQRARLSSLASSCAYSSAVFAGVGLYPVVVKYTAVAGKDPTPYQGWLLVQSRQPRLSIGERENEG